MPSSSKKKRGLWFGVLLTLVSAVLWGSTYPVIAIALQYYNPYEISFFRAAFAAATLSAYYVSRPRKARAEVWPAPRGLRTWLLLIGAAFLGAAGFWNLLNVSVLLLQPDTATFLAALYPIIAVALSVVVLKDKLTIGRGAGIILGIVGSYVIVSFGKKASITGSNPYLGVGIALATAFSFAGYIVITRMLIGREYGGSLPRTITPEYVTLTIFSISVVPTFLITAANGPIGELFQTSEVGIIMVLYLGVVASGVAFLVFNIGLSIIGPSRAAINQLLFPAVSVVISFFALGETINLGDGIGITLILVGIVGAQVISSGKSALTRNRPDGPQRSA